MTHKTKLSPEPEQKEAKVKIKENSGNLEKKLRKPTSLEMICPKTGNKKTPAHVKSLKIRGSFTLLV